MRRLLGSLLGVSFQTELLIMAFLGLAYYELVLKPFELIPQLQIIKNLHFNDDGIDSRNEFTSFIKLLIQVAVIIEFTCSLINPFAYLLKLYSIVTWSRSSILLPWFIIHILNTILLKLLIVVLALVIYAQNIISMTTLMEFLTVETINFLVASYNLYVFFAFYMDLREIDRKRSERQTRASASKDELPLNRSYSSTMNIQEIFGDNTMNSTEDEIFVTKSFSPSLVINPSLQEGDTDETSMTSSSIDETMSPAEKSMKILNLKQEDLDNIRKFKNELNAKSLYDQVVSSIARESVKSNKSDSSLDIRGKKCVCSSSDDDSDIVVTVTKKIQTDNFNPNVTNTSVSRSSIEIKTKARKTTKLKKMNSQLVQVNNNCFDRSLGCRSSQYTTDYPSTSSVEKGDNLHNLLNSNFETLDKMRQSYNRRKQSVTKNSVQKWILFRREFDSNLNNNSLLKQPKNLNGKRHLQDQVIQTEVKRKIRRRYKDDPKILYNRTNNPKTECKFIYDQNVSQCKINEIPITTNYISEEISSKELENKMSHRYECNKVKKSTAPFFYSVKNNIKSSNNVTHGHGSIFEDPKISKNFVVPTLNPKKPTQLSECLKNKDALILRNLKAYNKLTLEQDRKELLGKKEKSYMTNYEQVLKEFSLEDSDACTNKNLEKEKSEQLSKTSIATSENDKELVNNSDLPSNVMAIRSLNAVSTPNFKISKQNVTGNREANIEPLQTYRSSVREAIESLDWNIRSNTSTFSDPPKSSRNINFNIRREVPRRRVIADDETVSLLRSAFSYSDESDRGFRLGPDSNEPYPVFQEAALTMAEIFKATRWHNYNVPSTDGYNNGIEIPFTDDVIFCGRQEDSVESQHLVTCSQNVSSDNENRTVRNEPKINITECLTELQEVINSTIDSLLSNENILERDFHIDDDDDSYRLQNIDDLLDQNSRILNDIKSLEEQIHNLNEDIEIEPPMDSNVNQECGLNVDTSETEQPSNILSSNQEQIATNETINFSEQDIQSSTCGTVPSESKVKISRSQEILNDYRKYLDSEVITQRIASWADDVDSIDSFDHTIDRNQIQPSISFSDNSDFEEFLVE